MRARPSLRQTRAGGRALAPCGRVMGLGVSGCRRAALTPAGRIGATIRPASSGDHTTSRSPLLSRTHHAPRGPRGGPAGIALPALPSKRFPRCRDQRASLHCMHMHECAPAWLESDGNNSAGLASGHGLPACPWPTPLPRGEPPPYTGTGRHGACKSRRPGWVIGADDDVSAFQPGHPVRVSFTVAGCRSLAASSRYCIVAVTFSVFSRRPRDGCLTTGWRSVIHSPRLLVTPSNSGRSKGGGERFV